MKKQILTTMYLLLGSVASATPPQGKIIHYRGSSAASREASSARPELAPRESPCQEKSPYRKIGQQGTLLWGTGRTVETDETSTELASVDLQGVRRGGRRGEGLLLEQGRLLTSAVGAGNIVGAVLRGRAMDERSVEVAICNAEPSAQDPAMVWYQIEIWNEDRAAWENPCVATNRVPSPRALAVSGVWDRSGAHHEREGKFTFACENGAIAKCMTWGYKPWEERGERSLKELHQACTRMARADYCGNGRSHTREDNLIDMYDGLGVLTRMKEATAGWDPKRASFEAAWTPEGAACLSRTRDGRALETVLAECPERFEVGTKNLGEGDSCTVRRKGDDVAGAVLRNHSYRP